MNEQELLNKIKQSAEQEVIPETLMPQQIHKRLIRVKKTRPITQFPIKKAVSSAAVLLLFGVLSIVAWKTGRISPDKKGYVLENDTTTDNSVPAGARGPQRNLKFSPPDSEKDETAQKPSIEPKANAGELYKIAANYQEVYDVLQSSFELHQKYRAESNTDGACEKSAEDTVTEYSKNASGAEQKILYSTTNLQTQGVDESDSIKTDGQYIYTIAGATLKITDTFGGKLKPAGAITPDLDASDHILEFYIDQNMLFLLVQHYEPTITEETYYTDTDEKSGVIPLNSCDKIASFDANSSTILYTYDISSPANPILAGTVEQDGNYYTSRKIGDMIYLFTQQGLNADNFNGFIPCINNEKIPCGNIYISEKGNEGFLISSINVSEPDKILDKVMLVHNSVNVYVTTDAIYLYHSDYQAADTLTKIAKFSIDGGIINAVNATSVKGEIFDTFAVNAYQDTLRVLTTLYDQNGNTDNHLYILDSELNLIGALDGIARGEEIYAARYLDKTVYFITYKDTDPLFAVDLSNNTNPVVLGELKISGFSEYLHFWGKDQLLGIGYETDPDNGERKGLKLVMFDISNPMDLKVIDSLVLKDSLYSPALYHYKCALADPSLNLIGFAAEYSNNNAAYNVYSFSNGRFVPKLSETLQDSQYISYESVRGIYIGETFFIVCPTEIKSYEMANGFRKLEHLDLTD